jgi:FAD/FMN-containing dehydrogenase
MYRVKDAFDPHGILNRGKVLDPDARPTEAAGL